MLDDGQQSRQEEMQEILLTQRKEIQEQLFSDRAQLEGEFKSLHAVAEEAARTAAEQSDTIERLNVERRALVGGR